MSERDIRRNALPRHYELGLTPDSRLWLGIHPQVVKFLPGLLEREEAGMSVHLKDRSSGLANFEYTPFSTDKPWGFAEAMQPWDSDEQMLRWQIVTPPYIACPSPPQDSSGLCAALSLLLIMDMLHVIWMAMPELVAGPAPSQLLCLKLGHGNMDHAFNFMGTVSQNFATWVLDHLWDERKHISSNGCAVYSEVFGQPWTEEDFDVVIDDQGMIIQAPGNSCHVFTDEPRGIDDSRGWELDTHNVEAAGSQMALIAMLASICDMVRADAKK